MSITPPSAPRLPVGLPGIHPSTREDRQPGLPSGGGSGVGSGVGSATAPSPEPNASQGGEGIQQAAGGSPPAGMDPDLWSLLTREERAHFTRAQELGPLTYGRIPSPEGDSAPMRGVRLDVRA